VIEGIRGEARRRYPLSGAAVEGAINATLRHCSRCGENFGLRERVVLENVVIVWDAPDEVRFEDMPSAYHDHSCRPALTTGQLRALRMEGR